MDQVAEGVDVQPGRRQDVGTALLLEQQGQPEGDVLPARGPEGGRGTLHRGACES